MPAQKTLKPRKAPQQSRSQKTVQRILTAAAHILSEQGLEGFNTNVIAQSANISIGSLYQYFPDKDALTAVLICQHNEQFLKDLKGALDDIPKAPLENKLKALIRVAVAQQLSQPQLARLLDIEEARLPLDAELQSIQLEIASVIQSVLADRQYADVSTVIQDVVAIAKGMIDSAGAAGEKDAPALENRVYKAVAGYLTRT